MHIFFLVFFIHAYEWTIRRTFQIGHWQVTIYFFHWIYSRIVISTSFSYLSWLVFGTWLLFFMILSYKIIWENIQNILTILTSSFSIFIIYFYGIILYLCKKFNSKWYFIFPTTNYGTSWLLLFSLNILVISDLYIWLERSLWNHIQF